mmetsp:Transcript_12261/g.29363  ORF Transcript_12261/g.29363 Transcript_12261/m.29363 type:complete len:88 (-) Transcript_12261:2233-2496(-)
MSAVSGVCLLRGSVVITPRIRPPVFHVVHRPTHSERVDTETSEEERAGGWAVGLASVCVLIDVISWTYLCVAPCPLEAVPIADLRHR